MPRKMPSPCTHPGCPALVEGGGRCPAHRKKMQREYDQGRGKTAERGYDSRVWRKVRVMVLAEEPLCRKCYQQGLVVPATEVHHLDHNPHNNARENLESLCKSCHSRETMQGRGV